MRAGGATIVLPLFQATVVTVSPSKSRKMVPAAPGRLFNWGT